MNAQSTPSRPSRTARTAENCVSVKTILHRAAAVDRIGNSDERHTASTRRSRTLARGRMLE